MDELGYFWHTEKPKISSWYVWDCISFSNDYIGIENSLGLPNGTFSVLNRAFLEKLPRFIGWDLSNILAPQLEAYQCAAKIYKRGVRVKNQVDRIQKGFSPLVLLNSNEDFYSLLKDAFFIIDQSVFNHHSWLKYFHHKTILAVEELKTSETVSNILKIFKNINSKKIVALGGGCLLDLVGFAGFLDQKEITYIPSTLLAMVDAAYGGKVAINHEFFGKNMIGAFHNPKEIILWEGFLSSLPKSELDSGACEALKHAFLQGDRNFLNETVLFIKNIRTIDLAFLKKLIEVKLRILSLDPLEENLRSVLNLGHTMGHGLESFMRNENKAISHGKCVLFGMIFSFFLGEEKKYLAEEKRDYFLEVVKQTGLLKDFPWKDFIVSLGASERIYEIFNFLEHDKKKQSTNKRISWILLKNLGDVVGFDVTPCQLPSCDLPDLISPFLKTLNFLREN